MDIGRSGRTLKTVVSAWHGSGSSLGSGQEDARPRDMGQMSRKERSGWVIVTVLALVSLVITLAALAHFAIVGIGNAMSNLGKGIGQAAVAIEAGGTAANNAAASMGPQGGSLSASVLNARLPKYQWVDGATNVPVSSGKRYVVGVSASTTHIVTALQIAPGQCSYGLSVTSDEDPIITDDHLAWGSGTYYNLYPAPRCVADQAPVAGWIAWDSSLSGG